MKHWLTFIFMLLAGSHGFAQQNQMIISAEYNDQSFNHVVRDIEKKYPLKFYYSQNWTDSLSVTLKVDQVPITTFLNELLGGTEIYFHVTQDNRIILTKEHQIIAHLPDNFFEENKAKENQVQDLSIFDILEETEGDDNLTNIENQIFKIGSPKNRFKGDKATIVGYIKDIKSGEALIGSTVFKKEPLVGTTTDAFGYYVLTLPKGEHKLFFKSVGMKDTKRKIILYDDGRLDVEMTTDIIPLKEIIIKGEEDNVENVRTGIAKLDIKDIKTIPTVLGEADVMKITLTLPGVQSVGEGASGFNVRGGATDQNLILVNDAVIYNPNHLFGFFSAFNPDVIKSANLYKSGIQAHYGGRISSVFDVAIRDGNKKKFTVTGGISPITGKLTLEGPIKRDTSSFIVGLRSTYSDWLLGLLKNPTLRNSSASFADVIAKVNHQLDDRNGLIVSGYHSRDKFRLDSDSLYRYFNSNASIQWKHTFNNKFFSLVSANFTNYTYDVTSDENPLTAFELNYKINQIGIKSDFNFFPDSKHSLKFGISSNLYDLDPGNIKPLGEASLIEEITLDNEKGLESAIYVGDEFEYSRNLSLYAGLRLSVFNLIGPREVFLYQPGFARSKDFIIDTVSYDPGKIIKTYLGPEYRFSLRYKLRPDLSLKVSYDKIRQYIHMLSNTTAISPTDTWRLSDVYIKPQIGDQYSAGFYKSFFKRGIEFSLEGFYKTTKNLLEYKDGAELIVNEVLETDVISSYGKAYGAEFLLKKKTGKLNGWISYTYSRALIQANGQFKDEKINDGDFFPTNFDKPHNVNVVSNYKLNRRVNVSLNFTYSTGRPTTFPITKYQFKDNVYGFFTERNRFRVPDFMRLDFAINFEGNHKIKKLAHGSWSLSVYNVTGRHNAYSVFARSEDGNIKVFQLSIFSRPIPTVTYNFKF
ncbi:carboxypeptidase-like regulatory domain-containing protein [Fulvivirgaceae bacterium BMA10]|uniref:Carboxypeptidase-like regulatory domain-containing protein n=1 Tax=Splendidivirga corallicola TaxID=3051826 RepID=A0ABT8KI63_9BACT|nr:carboxypeptidase-like regulatory domain-containing protein [Fulvivirgaceae bacterium BMA10]